MTLLWAALASLLIYLSFVGLGRLFSLRAARGDFASAAALGMALACVIGGLLNLLHLISAVTIWILLLTGLGSWIFFLVRLRKRLGRYLVLSLRRRKIALLVLVPLLALSMAHGSLPTRNPHDDDQGYLVFSYRMLTAGHMGHDPFNERRLGVLGGQEFLNAVMLALVPARQLRAMDAVVGWLVFILLVMTHAHRRKVPDVPLALMLVLWHVHQPPAVNLSSLVTSLALFYFFLIRFSTPQLHGRVIEVVKTGIVVAALCSLKNTAIGGLAILAVSIVLLDGRLPFAQRLHFGLRVAGAGLVLLLPWMLAMYLSSETPLFPLLGQGTHTSWQQGAAPLSIRAADITWGYTSTVLVDVLAQPLALTGLLLLILVAVFVHGRALRPAPVEGEPRQPPLPGAGFARKNRERWQVPCRREMMGRERVRVILRRRSLSVNPVAIIALIAGLLGASLLSFATLQLQRYTYPVLFAVVAFLVVETMARHRSSGVWLSWVSLAFYAGLLWPDISSVMSKRADSFKKFAQKSAVHEMQPATVRRGQQAAPEGATIMAVISHPYLLDFNRNAIFVVDHAGSASPAPGLPLKGSAEDLASYLRQQQVDYLLYSFSDEGGYGRSSKYLSNRLRSRGTPYKDRTRILAENNFRFRDLIDQLQRTYPLTYKDEYSLLIDLSAALPEKPVPHVDGGSAE